MYSVLCAFGLTKFYFASDYLWPLSAKIFGPDHLSRVLSEIDNNVRLIRAQSLGTVKQDQANRSYEGFSHGRLLEKICRVIAGGFQIWSQGFPNNLLSKCSLNDCSTWAFNDHDHYNPSSGWNKWPPVTDPSPCDSTGDERHDHNFAEVHRQRA